MSLIVRQARTTTGAAVMRARPRNIHFDVVRRTAIGEPLGAQPFAHRGCKPRFSFGRRDDGEAPGLAVVRRRRVRCRIEDRVNRRTIHRLVSATAHRAACADGVKDSGVVFSHQTSPARF
jgi:hypothetical protein